MPFGDMTLQELEQYRPEIDAPVDFDARWRETLAEARALAQPVDLEPVDSHLAMVKAFDMTFSGFGGDPIKAWFLRPRGLEGDLPVVVEFVGYGGGRGLVHERLLWPVAGYAYVVMDTRGQGSVWSGGGATADASAGGAAGAPAAPGYFTQGVRDFDSFYYRRLITDAALCVEAARTLPGVDPSRVVVAGGSQGGGLAIAAAGLVDGIAAVLPDVPFLCHIRRGVEVAETDPYQEIARFLAIHRDDRDAVMATLDYVDGVHHGARATAPALFSVALRDQTCPASTVYAAFHRWGGPKQIEVYPYNDHEGGEAYQQRRQLEFLASLWAAGSPEAD